jgi:hypothetical protein
MPRTTAQKKVARDRQIVHDRMLGLTWTTIATKYKLSERQCRTVVAQYRQEQVDLDEIDAIERVREYVERHELLLEHLAVLYSEARQEGIKLGIIRTQLAALQQKLMVEQAIRLVPALNLLRYEIELEHVSNAMAAFLDRFGLTQKDRQELAATIDPVRVWRGRRNGVLPGS